MESDSSRLNSDATRTFCRQKISNRRALVHVTNAPGEAAVEEHALRCGGLASIDMGDDSNVASSVQSVTLPSGN
jgi:hypothetical protein